MPHQSNIIGIVMDPAALLKKSFWYQLWTYFVWSLYVSSINSSAQQRTRIEFLLVMCQLSGDDHKQLKNKIPFQRPYANEPQDWKSYTLFGINFDSDFDE